MTVFASRRKRLSCSDLILLTLLLGGAFYIGYRAVVFLDYPWSWESIPQFFFKRDAASGSWVPNLLVQGFFTTIRLSIWATLMGTVVGVAMGLARTSRSLFLSLIGQAYVGLSRNIPPLVLIFIFYFFIGDQLLPFLMLDEFFASGPGLFRDVVTLCLAPPHLLTPFISGVVALALLEGAYITEIVRAGIESIDKGQWEAAASLGFPRCGQMCYVVLPQALPRMLLPLAGQFISTIKDSAIVSVVSIQELTFQGMEIMAATYLSLEIWITITLLYFILTFACSLLVQRFEFSLRRRWGVGLG
jgi:polar amino acid transport system permease protein